MKKTEKSWEKRYTPLKLFKEDVEEILNIITTEFKQTDTQRHWLNEVRISVGGFDLDSPDELGQISTDVVDKLDVSVGAGRIRLFLGELAYLEIDDREDTKLMGIANRINEILRKRQRPFGYLSTPQGFALLFTSPLFFVLCFLFLFPKLSKATVTSLSLPYWIVWIVGMCYHLYREKHFSTIYMYYSSEKPSFFKRNKDRIYVGIIVSSATVVLTLLTQWIIRKFSS